MNGKIVGFLLSSWVLCAAGDVLGVSSCLDMANQRGLTGAARSVFLEQCESLGRAACAAEAQKQRLAGREKEKFLQLCNAEIAGVR